MQMINRVEQLIDRTKGKYIYFSKDKDNDLIQKNIQDGKKAVFIDEDNVMCD